MSAIMISDWAKLGAVIRDARAMQGLTQNELASNAKVSRSWVARVESGHRGAELEQILRLLSALGMSLVLKTSSDRQEPLPASNASKSDDRNSLVTPTRARDSKSRKEASRALLAAHREAASRRQDSWRTAQASTEGSPVDAERGRHARVGSE